MQHPRTAAVASTSGRCAAACPQSLAFSSRRMQHWARPHLRGRLSLTARAGNAGSSSSFSEQARQFAESAQQRMQSFVQDQKLDQKASAAAEDAKKAAKQMADEAEQTVRRTYMKLESEHNISERLGKTKRWFSETAREFDQEYSVRRRIKSTVDDVQRMLPTWRRQLAAFSSTQLGKASLTLLFVALLFSGLLWQLLNVFWLLWWVSVPVSLFLASQRSKAAAGGTAPNGSGFSNGSSNSSSSSDRGSSWGGYNNSSSSSRYSGDGPVVEAEWTSIDDDDDGSSRRRR